MIFTYVLNYPTVVVSVRNLMVTVKKKCYFQLVLLLDQTETFDCVSRCLSPESAKKNLFPTSHHKTVITAL